MGSKQAEETGWQIQKPPWATWIEGGEGGLSASCPMMTRAAREWPSFHITLLLKRKEPSFPTPLEDNNVKSFRGRGQGEGTGWVMSLSTQGRLVEGYAGVRDFAWLRP